MTKPEAEVRKRVNNIFTMRNIAEMARRSGYRHETLRRWKNDPLMIKAVDLLRLEQLTGLAQDERTTKRK